VALGGAVLGGGALSVEVAETAVNVDYRPATKLRTGS
jgi:hypothetical protein